MNILYTHKNISLQKITARTLVLQFWFKLFQLVCIWEILGDGFTYKLTLFHHSFLSVWYLSSCTYLVHSSGIRDRVCVLDDWYRLSCQDGLVNSQGGREDLDETDISRYLVTNCKLLSKLLYKLLYSHIQHKSLPILRFNSKYTDWLWRHWLLCMSWLFILE
jgi:hypothetical protein